MKTCKTIFATLALIAIVFSFGLFFVNTDLFRGYKLYSSVNKDGLRQLRNQDKASTDPLTSFVPVNKSINPTVINIDPAGNFLKRVELFNDILITKHQQYIIGIMNKQWQDTAGQLEVLWLVNDDAIYHLDKFTSVTTYYLKWHKDWNQRNGLDENNVLTLKYYNWSGTIAVCRLIRLSGVTKARWDLVYNQSCTMAINLTNKPIPLEPLYFNTKPVFKNLYWPNNGHMPAYFYTHYPDDILYIHKIDDALFLENGDVITHNLKLVPYTCDHDTMPIAPEGYKTSPLYDQVFSISQYWGGGFFHRMLEDIPRLAPFIKFLKAYPSIKIHCKKMSDHLVKNIEFLGLNADRLITGLVRTKIAYMPKTTYCGFVQVQNVQILNNLYISKSAQLYGPSNLSLVVLIRRSSYRKFLKNDEMTQMIRSIVKEFKRRLVIFKDDPVPSFEETVRIFYNAVLVVAPHGAGLSNLIHSLPGTYVIEGVCNEPHMNMCYQRMNHVLGNRYHAILSRGGCESFIDIEPIEMGKAVTKYLQLINENDT